MSTPERITGANIVAQIRNWVAQWNSRIIPHLRSLEVVAGPGITIDRRPTGTIVSALPQNVRPSGGSVTLPLWQVTFTEEGKLSVFGGFLNVNGLRLVWHDGGEIAPAAGFLCVCTEPADKLGNWTPVSFKILQQPNCCAFPLAEISAEGEGFFVTQYPVTVATIIYSKKCPIAEL